MMTSYVSRTDAEYLAERLLGLSWSEMHQLATYLDVWLGSEIGWAGDEYARDDDARAVIVASGLIRWAQERCAEYTAREDAAREK